MNPAAIPLALYLHLPWCVRKCPYCDFNSFTATKTPPRARYIDALKRDLDLSRHYAAGRPLGSVFLGGGTPSLFTPGEIAQILDAVRERFDVPAAAEITMRSVMASPPEDRGIKSLRVRGGRSRCAGFPMFPHISVTL
mgnify:CR=1 FL=1